MKSKAVINVKEKVREAIDAANLIWHHISTNLDECTLCSTFGELDLPNPPSTGRNNLLLGGMNMRLKFPGGMTD